MRLGELRKLFIIPALLCAWTVGVAGTRTDVQGTPLSGARDDRGNDVRLGHFSHRIISLSPSITELVYAAGAGDKLVGADLYSNYPDAVKLIPRIGDASNLDLERIVALEPDLVIAWRGGSAAADIRRLERLGLNVAAIEASRLEDVPRLLRMIGRWAGTSTQAESAALIYENELGHLSRSYADREKISVVQLIWRQPLMTVNRNHIISDVINICGGANLFASAPTLTPVIAMENLLEAHPRAIVSSILPQFDEREVRSNGLIDECAMEGSQVIFVHPDLMHRQTPRILQAARKVCEGLEKVRTAPDRE
jgi:iron complex transport system substrate-binding protein